MIIDADKSQQPKTFNKNHLPKHVFKVSFNKRKLSKRQKTFADTKVKKANPKNYLNKSVHDSDQVKRTKR